MDLKITRKQKAFIESTAFETLFGGAAGGGKSYGQLLDAELYALRYPGSQQLILRRTYPELEKSLIRVAQEIYPQELYRYNDAKHVGRWANGSIIDFGYCDSESDVYRYQSAQYDVVRFDELTHFTEPMYLYLISRVRGVNGYPKAVKSSTNPGGVGHVFVKERFVDLGPPNVLHETPNGSRIFIPSLVEDNRFLMDADPEYLVRLENLPEDEKQKLRYGNWDVFEGQYFTEFRRKIHVILPFALPDGWRRYAALDYGLDMLACYWIAVDEQGRAYVYRELYEGMDNGMEGHIVSSAAARIREMTAGESVYAYLAPPDLWARQKDTGKSIAELFRDHGIVLTKAKNDRVAGWMNLKEWLHPVRDERGELTAALRIFDCCVNLIRCLPQMRHDGRDPNDCAREPHNITHAPDALRYFTAGRPAPGRRADKKTEFPFHIAPARDALGRGETVEVL